MPPTHALPLPPPPPGTTRIHRPGPEAVTYHIPHAPPASPTDPLKTTIHLPPRSAWTSGLHYHATHTEYLRLVRGCIAVRLGPRSLTLSAAAGGAVDARGVLVEEGLVVEVPRYARHEWGRADRGQGTVARTEDGADEVVVEEWTAPSDMDKALFFWNLNGVVTAPGVPPLLVPGDWWVPLQLGVIFWALDNWPVVLDMEGWLGGGRWERAVEGAVSWWVLCVGSLVGRVVGVQAVREERTPRALWEAWIGSRGRGSGKED